MGYEYRKRPLQAPGLRDIGGGLQAATALAFTTGRFTTAQSITLGGYFLTSGTIIPNRVVKLTSGGVVRHTTGTSGRRVFGVALTSNSTAKIALFGIVYLQASTAAIKRGDWLTATSGSISTGSQLGGTVKTKPVPTSVLHTKVSCCGFALTSAAAGAGARKILALLNPIGLASTLA